MSLKYVSKLQGQRLLILGGTSGIGYCVAEAALESGVTVIISGSKQTKVDEKVKELRKSYPDAYERISGKACDLANLDEQESNIVALLDFATENNTKKLDHIIKTAGDMQPNPAFSELTIETIYKAQTVRVIAPLMIAKHAETYLKKSPSSSLTFTSGAGIYRPTPGRTLLPVVCSMLDGLIRVLAVNLAPIRVNGIAPGVVLTELWGMGQKLSEEKAKSITDNWSGKTLTGQIGTPEDLAEAYLYLIKDHFVTGRLNFSEGGYFLK